MRGTGREVDEERLIRRQRLLVLHPVDRMVGHVGHEVVVRVCRRLDLVHAVIEQRRPLVGLAADEAIELVEAGAGRPAVGRAGGADLPGRGLVRFSERRRAVAVEPQHLRQRCHAVGALPGLPGKSGGGLGDRAHVVHVVVAAGEQRGSRRRAKRRGVELVVAQALVGEFFHRRHVNRSAEGARLPKPMSSISTMSTLGALAGALTSNRGGGVALRTSSTVLCGYCGSGSGSTVRSVGSTTLAAAAGWAFTGIGEAINKSAAANKVAGFVASSRFMLTASIRELRISSAVEPSKAERRR